MIKNKGMTLLEVMIALAIFAIAGLAIMMTIGGQVQGLIHLEERIYSSWVAENTLTRIKINNIWPEETWTDGSSFMAGRQWYWRWQMVELKNLQVKQVIVEVRKSKNKHTPIVTLKGYVVKS